MTNGKYRLLQGFRSVFEGVSYKHRDSTIGNRIGRALFEDLLYHNVSAAYREHVRNGRCVVSLGGGIHGRLIRRNDSIFGLPPAGVMGVRRQSGLEVFEGPVAEPRVGCEVKILAKAQLKQIDRVISDLDNFATRMKRLNERCINVAIVGVNHESNYLGHEGERTFRGKLGREEPRTTIGRLGVLREVYDELLILGFKATNQPPYPFGWLDTKMVELDYASALTRVGERYQERFA